MSQNSKNKQLHYVKPLGFLNIEKPAHPCLLPLIENKVSILT